MSLQCGITGLTNSGKTTLFNSLSKTRAEATAYAFSASKSNVGQIAVPDRRLQKLESLQPTERIVPTVVEIVDIPGLAKGASRGEGVGNKFLGDLRTTDAIIHVLRCFDDPNLPHVEGSVDPVRDMELVAFELQVKDLESIDKKLQRQEKLIKAGDKQARQAVEVLKKYKAHMEDMQPADTAPVTEEEQLFVKDLTLLTMKPVLFVCNVDDASATVGNRYVDAVRQALEGRVCEMLVIAAELEAEIAELDDEKDREAFLHDAGLAEPGVNKLIRTAYQLLNLKTFFTVGPKEIRAWTIKAGMTAQQAAGVIHSDLERGFIRAEVMKYNDFVELGSEQAVKNAGKFHVEGKNYIVDDGDILHVRFNV